MSNRKELLAKEAAKTLGVSLEWVYRLIRTGRLEARKQFEMWFVPVAAVERLKTEPTRPRRKP